MYLETVYIALYVRLALTGSVVHLQNMHLEIFYEHISGRFAWLLLSKLCTFGDNAQLHICTTAF